MTEDKGWVAKEIHKAFISAVVTILITGIAAFIIHSLPPETADPIKEFLLFPVEVSIWVMLLTASLAGYTIFLIHRTMSTLRGELKSERLKSSPQPPSWTPTSAQQAVLRYLAIQNLKVRKSQIASIINSAEGNQEQWTIVQVEAAVDSVVEKGLVAWIVRDAFQVYFLTQAGFDEINARGYPTWEP